MTSFARDLTGPLFGDTFAGPSWAAWRTFWRAVAADPPEPGDLELFQACTGRETWPAEPASELWLCCGRRGGKSRQLAAFAAQLALAHDWSDRLAPGEPGVIAIVSPTIDQARIIAKYVRAFLEAAGLDGVALVERDTVSAVELRGQGGAEIRIEVLAASWRSIRGRTLIALILDECAFLRSEGDGSANAAEDLIAAAEPGLLTTGGYLIGASSPYARAGALFAAFRRLWGQDEPGALFWRAASRVMNPGLPEAVIAKAMARDPVRARSEYEAQWRDDVAAFLARDLVEAAVVPGRASLPPLATGGYHAFADPSGGRHDSFTLAVAHADGNRVVVDLAHEIPAPFDPDRAVRELAKLLKGYGLSTVTGDRFAGAWVESAFAGEGIRYTPSERSRSEIYLAVLPLLAARRLELPDSDRLVAQLAALERRTSRSGRDTVDHPPNGADDLANAVAGAAVLVAARPVLCPDAEIFFGPPLESAAPDFFDRYPW